MLTGMTEDDWAVVIKVFDASQTRSGEPGHDDRKFLEAVHYFTVHNITWRALPEEFGNWNSVWKRFWRLSRSGDGDRYCLIVEPGMRRGPLGQPVHVGVPFGSRARLILIYLQSEALRTNSGS